jgi:hypothetical protein
MREVGRVFEIPIEMVMRESLEGTLEKQGYVLECHHGRTSIYKKAEIPKISACVGEVEDGQILVYTTYPRGRDFPEGIEFGAYLSDLELENSR